MPEGLETVRVAVFETRMGSELAELIRRRGGIPTCVPAVREVAFDCAREVGSFIDAQEERSLEERRRVVIFLTGAGAGALFKEAERLGRLAALVRALSLDVVVARGPKPVAVLRRHGIFPGLHVPDPYTSAELLRTLLQIDLKGRGVTLLHYGERNASLAEAIVARGAVLRELCLYAWQLPEDLAPLRAMVTNLVGGRFDAVVFTSQIQCRHLFQIAADMRMSQALADALNEQVVVAAIGPTCQAAIEEFGVRPHVVPQPPKMGALVGTLADHFLARR